MPPNQQRQSTEGMCHQYVQMYLVCAVNCTHLFLCREILLQLSNCVFKTADLAQRFFVGPMSFRILPAGQYLPSQVIHFHTNLALRCHYLECKNSVRAPVYFLTKWSRHWYQRASVKEATPLPSAVQWWMKKARVHGTGVGQCFAFPPELWCCYWETGRKNIPLVTKSSL